MSEIPSELFNNELSVIVLKEEESKTRIPLLPLFDIELLENRL